MLRQVGKREVMCSLVARMQVWSQINRPRLGFQLQHFSCLFWENSLISVSISIYCIYNGALINIYLTRFVGGENYMIYLLQCLSHNRHLKDNNNYQVKQFSEWKKLSGTWVWMNSYEKWEIETNILFIGFFQL